MPISKGCCSEHRAATFFVKIATISYTTKGNYTFTLDFLSRIYYTFTQIEPPCAKVGIMGVLCMQHKITLF